MNTANHQDFAVFFDFTFCLGNQPTFTGRYFARFQRAAKSTGQSAGRSGNDIIQRGRVGFMDLGINAVMFGDLGMHAKFYGLLFLGQVSATKRAFYSFNFYFGCIDNFSAHIPSFLDIHHESTKKWKREKNKISCFRDYFFKFYRVNMNFTAKDLTGVPIDPSGNRAGCKNAAG